MKNIIDKIIETLSAEIAIQFVRSLLERYTLEKIEWMIEGALWFALIKEVLETVL